MTDFLSTGLQMANQEATTPIWFALRPAPNMSGIFDAFASEKDHQAHLDGLIARALIANAVELLASSPEIASIRVFGLKNTGAT